jgi:alcohol dehydrogenase, propanol-preferring
MKAARFHKVGAPLKVEEIPEPKASKSSVVLKVKGAGLCYTDIHLQNGVLPLQMPIVLGHEIAGEVQEVGPESAGVKKGDHAVVHFWNACGACAACLDGQPMLCEVGWNQLGWGFGHDGGYEEQCVVESSRLVPVPKEVPLDFASTLGCAGITAHHAVNVRGRARAEDVAVIYGLGGVGLYGVQFAHLSGATTIAVGRKSEKLRRAEQLGASAVVDSTKGKVEEEVKKAAGGKAPSLWIDFVSSPESTRQAMAALRPGGRYVMVGLGLEPVQLAPPDMVFREISVSGSLVGNKKEQADVIEFARRGLIKSIVSKTMPIDDINEGFDHLRKGEVVGRSVVVPGSGRGSH